MTTPRKYLSFATLLLVPVILTAQIKQNGVIALNHDGSVAKFYGLMAMYDAHPLPSRSGERRYVSEQFTEGSYAKKYACALVLTVEGSRSAVVQAGRDLGVNTLEIPMYSVSQECFSFNGAEVDDHIYDANMDGWQITSGAGYTGRYQTGGFRPEDPDRDVVAYQYVVTRFKRMAENYQQMHPAQDGVRQ